MPDDAIEPREHYVYALLREDEFTPFYIGIGKGRRWTRHEREFDGSNPHKEAIIRKMLRSGLSTIPKIKLANALTRREAADYEIAVIAMLGRHPHGPLVNMTMGGEGIAGISAEGRARQRQATVDRWAADRDGMMRGTRKAVEAARAPEACRRRAESVKRSWDSGSRKPNGPLQLTQADRDRRRLVMNANRAALSSASATPESRERLSASLKRSLATPEAKARRSAAMKKMWAERRHEILQKRAARRHQKTEPPSE